MIDMHCHLLPGLDDGPATLVEAVALARLAVADGITTSVVTPHIHPGRYNNHREKILVYLRAFRLALAQQAIPLDLRLGAEVRVCIESLELLKLGKVPFMGEHQGFRVVLLELPHGTVPVGTLRLVDKLVQMNIRPMIAHPERNKAIMDKPARIEPFLAAGCWLQLTAGSLTGDFGTSAQKLAHMLMDDGSVRVVASDAHNASSRPPVLSKARAYIGKRWGADVANDVMLRNPRQILGIGSAYQPIA